MTHIKINVIFQLNISGGDCWGGGSFPPVHRSTCLGSGRLSLPGLQQQLLGKLHTKLEVLREEESCLRLEWSIHTEQSRGLEAALELVARTYEIDKFRLQVNGTRIGDQ